MVFHSAGEKKVNCKIGFVWNIPESPQLWQQKQASGTRSNQTPPTTVSVDSKVVGKNPAVVNDQKGGPIKPMSTISGVRLGPLSRANSVAASPAEPVPKYGVTTDLENDLGEVLMQKQISSFTQFYSVDLSRLRIGKEKCVFNIHTVCLSSF